MEDDQVGRRGINEVTFFHQLESYRLLSSCAGRGIDYILPLTTERQDRAKGHNNGALEDGDRDEWVRDMARGCDSRTKSKLRAST